MRSLFTIKKYWIDKFQYGELLANEAWLVFANNKWWVVYFYEFIPPLMHRFGRHSHKRNLLSLPRLERSFILYELVFVCNVPAGAILIVCAVEMC